MEGHGVQTIVNSHIVLANLGSEAYVLNVDVDEFMVTDNRTTLEELANGCLNEQTAVLGRRAPSVRAPLGRRDGSGLLTHERTKVIWTAVFI